jgi:hypothetical protein
MRGVCTNGLVVLGKTDCEGMWDVVTALMDLLNLERVFRGAVEQRGRLEGFGAEKV